MLTGKGGVNVIIADGDYERSSSSVEDDTIPIISSNPTLLSPITTCESKSENIEPQAELTPTVRQTIKPITPSKTDSTISDNIEGTLKSIWVRIQLSKLNINSIPALRKQVEATRPWLLEPTTSPKFTPKTDEYNIKNEDKHTNYNDSKSNIVKRARGEDHKETKSDNIKEIKNDVIKEPRNDGKKSSHPEEYHRDRKNKSKKRKRKNSSSSISSHSTISNLSQSSIAKHTNKDLEDSKTKRRKDDPELRPQTENLNLTTTPPTNHEREACRIPSTKSSDHISPNTKPRSNRQYRSYFEPPDEPPDLKKR